ncbi:hypothetical protein D3C80_1534110 [compost metagenome]
MLKLVVAAVDATRVAVIEGVTWDNSGEHAWYTDAIRRISQLFLLPVDGDICLIDDVIVTGRDKVVGAGNALAVDVLSTHECAGYVARSCSPHVFDIFVAIENLTGQAEAMATFDILVEFHE